MTRKDTILRILIVVGVLYTVLLIVLIIFFAMSIHALSGLRISYENPFKDTETKNEVISFPVNDENPTSIEPTQSEQIRLAAESAYINEQSQKDNWEVTLAEDTTTVIDGWAFGSIVVKNTKTPDNPPADGLNAEPHYFIAKKVKDQWFAAIEYTEVFKEWLAESPEGLVNPNLKEIFLKN